MGIMAAYELLSQGHSHEHLSSTAKITSEVFLMSEKIDVGWLV
jgi:hypothetical protein